MKESEIEKYLVDQCKTIGALCEKFTSPARRSVPDRIITYCRMVIFVELKATGVKPSEMQLRDHRRRIAQGAVVYVIDSMLEVDWLIEKLQKGYYAF